MKSSLKIGGIAIFFAGVDIGSTMTKVIVLDDAGKVIAHIVHHTDAEHRRLANQVMEEALQQAKLSFDEITYVVATGYGRINVPFADRQITELTCHARGVASFFPDVRTAIDIGGQDAKGMKIKDGVLTDFVMNDKCAAGTGRFLEVLAATLGLTLDELGPLSLKSTSKVQISSTCTVFARQEVAERLAEGAPIADIVAGVHHAIASRVIAMLSRLGIEPRVVFTGGVAKNVGVIQAIEEYLGVDVSVPDDPLISGALGAALMAKELVAKAQAKGQVLAKKERRLKAATFFTEKA